MLRGNSLWSEDFNKAAGTVNSTDSDGKWALDLSFYHQQPAVLGVGNSNNDHNFYWAYSLKWPSQTPMNSSLISMGKMPQTNYDFSFGRWHARKHLTELFAKWRLTGIQLSDVLSVFVLKSISTTERASARGNGSSDTQNMKREGVVVFGLWTVIAELGSRKCVLETQHASV